MTDSAARVPEMKMMMKRERKRKSARGDMRGASKLAHACGRD
jgi:hypothetical protein